MDFYKSGKPKHKQKKKSNIFKNTMIAIGVSSLLFSNYLPARAESVSDVNNKINNLQGNVHQATIAKDQLTSESAMLDAQIAQLQGQISSTQGIIDQTNQDIANIQSQINETQAKLDVQKGLMKEQLSTMYTDGQASPIEMIASSGTFSELMDRIEYLETMQQNIQKTEDQISASKKVLDQKQADLKNQQIKNVQLQQSLESQKAASDNAKAAKQAAIAEQDNQIQHFNSEIDSLVWMRNKLMTPPATPKPVAAAAPAATAGSASNAPAAVNVSGSYPYAGRAQDSGVDPWGFYYRECTSYAAWWSANNGPIPGSILSQWGHSESANGGDWGNLAVKYGLHTSSKPSAGAVMSMPGYLLGSVAGHVAIVEYVIDANTVMVKDCNWNLDGRITEHPVRSAGSIYITR